MCLHPWLGSILHQYASFRHALLRSVKSVHILHFPLSFFTHTHAHTKPRPNHSTNPDFMITLTILGIYHHPMHSIYKHTKTHNLNNTQVAHIRLEPKSSHTIKYSQPLKLVLFHIIVPHINYFKCFYYPP